MPDSFWYFGQWYPPGETLYFSPDGWLSFDESIADEGAPTPPLSIPYPNVDAPNELIAPLWADYNPQGGAEPSIRNNRYYQYDEGTKTLIFEWHWVRSNAKPANQYNFQARLQLGGQDMLIKEGSCGVIFSFHFIHFLYDSCSVNWTADNANAGIENQSGTAGLCYWGMFADGRVIRIGYKKVFKHDVGVSYVSLDPPLPESGNYTPGSTIKITAIVKNYGTEYEQFPVKCEITDYTGLDTIVYLSTEDVYIVPWWSTQVVFPTWTFNPSATSPMEKWVLRCSSEMVYDSCPENDYYRIRYGFEGLEEHPSANNPYEFEVQSPISNEDLTISYTLSKPGRVRIATYDVSGKHLMTLKDGDENAGIHEMRLSNARLSLPRGLYFIRMEAEGFSASRKLVVLK
jgi:hypothetical protein